MKKRHNPGGDTIKHKKQAAVGDGWKRVSITDCTEDEKGLGFVIGTGGGTDQQHDQLKRSPSGATPGIPVKKKGGPKPESK